MTRVICKPALAALKNRWHASGAAEIEDPEAAIRRAADWARDNLRLEFKRLRKNGTVWLGLASARDREAR